MVDEKEVRIKGKGINKNVVEMRVNYKVSENTGMIVITKINTKCSECGKDIEVSGYINETSYARFSPLKRKEELKEFLLVSFLCDNCERDRFEEFNCKDCDWKEITKGKRCKHIDLCLSDGECIFEPE